MAGQTAIRCMMMRGGTSKGAYFLASDLPADPGLRDRILLAVMGSPDPRQIDGMGGAHPLTSKVAIVSPSSRPDADVDYLFLQVVPDKPIVSTQQNCGNILCGIGYFAIERGLVPSRPGTTSVRVHMVNSASLAELVVQTPGGVVEYDGDAAIDGVPGTAAPLVQNFFDTAGSQCGVLLPTGNAVDVIDGVACTLIDNGMPVVVLKAADVGARGDETPAELEANDAVRAKVEAIRLEAGPMMGLGDVAAQTVPKMTLVAPARAGGMLVTRTFIPHRVHEGIGVLGAVSVATAALIPDTPGHAVAKVSGGPVHRCEIEHPTGQATVEIEVDPGARPIAVRRAGVIRTARKLSDGDVFIPRRVWDGRP